MNIVEFDAVIQASDVGKGGTFVCFPTDTEETFGTKGRVKVQCEFDGVPYRVLSSTWEQGLVLAS